MLKLNIKKVSWKTIKSEVKTINSSLYKAIEQAKPSTKHILFKAKYKFGDLITENGVMNLPSSDGTLLPITSELVPPDIKNKISYRSIPLFLILKNSCEVFVDMNTRTIPLNIFNSGRLLGIFEAHDFLTNRISDPIWTVSAGGRSIFMLPGLADNQGFNRLRRYYELSLKKTPRHLKDHWQLFKEIINSPKFDQAWSCEILIFPEIWLNTSDPSLFEFQLYLFGDSWIQSQYAMAKVKFSFTWQIFIASVYKRHLNLRSYLADTAKHLFLIALKEWPGFCPSDNSQSVAPTLGLQKAIIDIYQLKNYLPTIMHPSPLADIERLFPVYYSLSYPTLLEGEPEHGTTNRIMPDLRDIKTAMDTFFDKITPEQQLKLGNIKDICFNYFHTEDDVYNEVYKSSDIIQSDSRFIELQKEFKNRTLCTSSIFWRGCIRISTK
jgi:hypothetical protein